ncbi:GMP synthase [glutamine-hydrolyzing]-like [Lucilia sericata]|uniref:GMP synthase [glutamine-hydrolyzing]-like n=1 Tax=Lucilia sericata TaxID=13632 RepID=UPI0018A8339D|nr:GMP synthase [glutamine-hydrolyzing]-like [Lucilia sericata]
MIILKRFKSQITKYNLKSHKFVPFNCLQRSKTSVNVCPLDKVVILDAGSQYVKLIKRKVEELCIASDILPLETSACSIMAGNYKAIIISGGPYSVYAKNAPRYDSKIFQLKIPLLGICYGMQMLNQEFGGSIKKKSVREDGQYHVVLDMKCKLFKNMFEKQMVLLTHGDSVEKVGDNLKISARSEKNIIAGIYNDDLQLYVRVLRNKGRLIEPLSHLNKDEVRKLAKDLKVPNDIREKPPFPGCGLAIRIICAQEPFKGKDFCETQEMVSYIVDYRQHLPKNDKIINYLKNNLTKTEQNELLRITSQNQLQASLLPIRSVGVQGDGRSYKYVLGISCYQEPNWCDLFYLARLIPTILHNINRVCYIFGEANSHLNLDITPTTLNKENIQLLREADKLANDLLKCEKLYHKITQMPVILIPLDFDSDPNSDNKPSHKRSIVLRLLLPQILCVAGRLTRFRAIAFEGNKSYAKQISELSGISRVQYDLTNKPPATIEWE